MKKLEHLGEIAKNYDTFIIDLWGVIHNGIQLNEDAILTIEKLHNMKKKIVFLSNAPRGSSIKTTAGSNTKALATATLCC